MKTKNVALLIVLILAGTMTFAQKVEVNTEKSSVEWVGKKIGGQHVGNIQLKSGALELNDHQIVSGHFVIDMNTMTNTDLTDEGYKQKLIGHLKSDDFFGVDKYPTAHFKVTQTTAFKDGKATVTGDLTIKGKTQPITFDVTHSGEAYVAKIKIDRSKYDVRYGSNSFFDNLGDKAIDDIFTLDIKLAVK